MKKNIFVTILFVYTLIPISAQSQYFSIIGKVYGEERIVSDTIMTNPLRGTYIQIKEFPNRGWLSDMGGYFKIDSLRSEEYHLKFSYIGLEYYDTVVFVKPNIQPLQILLSINKNEDHLFSPMLTLILSKGEENQVIQNPFWNKFSLRMSYYTKESLKEEIQRLDASGFSYNWTKNQKIFEYLDKRYGYGWRFQAPKGIIGLDETLNHPIKF